MKRSYSLAIEGESGSYSAYVPEPPAILVTGKSLGRTDGERGGSHSPLPCIHPCRHLAHLDTAGD
jgi:hypothetical protein